MSRTITKSALAVLTESGISTDDVVGTGADGTILKSDALAHLKALQPKEEVSDAEIIEPTEIVVPKYVNTTLRLFQLTHSKTKGTYESFNYVMDFNQVGDVDLKHLARFVSSIVAKFTDTSMKFGLKTVFSPSKPIWFEMLNGTKKIQLNLSVDTRMTGELRAKRGAKVLNRAELVNNIEGIFEMNDFSESIRKDQTMKFKKFTNHKDLVY